jgi:RNA polymerase sigma-70 factor, ECF subfamily
MTTAFLNSRFSSRKADVTSEPVISRPTTPGSPRANTVDAAAVDETATGHSMEDLRVLYDIYGGEIFRFCNRLVGDRGTAEEAVQETFLRAWRSAKTWDPAAGSIRTWMYAIARNVSIDLLRSRSRRVRVEPQFKSADDRNDGFDPYTSISVSGNHERGSDDAGFDTLMSSWMLEEALRRISPDHRDALVLTYVRDRPYAEIATVLGIPEATLRTRVFYGLKSLRSVLDEMGWHE